MMRFFQPTNLKKLSALLLLLAVVTPLASGFLPATSYRVAQKSQVSQLASSSSSSSSSSTSSTTATNNEPQISKLQASVADLKRVLEREYISFFDPMERDYYSPTVSFEDPMTALAGVDAYQQNVDMLASRTLLGKVLFADAGIVLHSVEGGSIDIDTTTTTPGKIPKISNIVTRWTLRVTAKILPWSPTARFSGISVYDVVPGGPKGVMVEHQTDYWDSINIKPNSNGDYQKVDKSIAVSDFLNQLKPENAIAPSAGPELPYQLLRRGDGYEVRRYPSYSAVKIPYERRDEAFGTLGSFTSGMSPLAPAIMSVANDSSKAMTWPLNFAPPGQTNPPDVSMATQKLEQEKRYQALQCQVETIPNQVVAVGAFSDASVEPVVRKADRELRQALERDGLQVEPNSESRVTFAQYDAIFSMGKRRGEVWIPLKDGGHPW